MKRIFSLICLALAVSFASAQQLPDVKVETAQGKIVSVRDLSQGKPLIIAYWSIACKPCIQELNAINDALEDWRKEADFEVVAVSTDDARLKAPAKNMATSRGWEFTCLFDDKQVLRRAMNVTQTPQAFVVDAEGNIIGKVTSGIMLPTTKIGVGMGYVQTAFAKKETIIYIKIREKLIPAKIV